MPVADPAAYAAMLDAAKAGRYAFPAVNVRSSETLNAVLRGLAEAESDGIIQVSSGGGAFASGSAVRDMVLGACALADHARTVAERYRVLIGLPPTTARPTNSTASCFPSSRNPRPAEPAETRRFS